MRKIAWAGVATSLALCGCQTPPSFDKVPGVDSTAPRVSTIVKHLQCELYHIVKGDDPVLVAREQSDPALGDLVKRLSDNHFVVSTSLQLQVTDQQGINPTLSFMAPHPILRTLGLGGMFDFQQDRTYSQSVPIDLFELQQNGAFSGCDDSEIGIQGNLGLAEIVIDGLHSIDDSKRFDIYGSAGSQIPSTLKETLVGSVTPSLTSAAKGDRTAEPATFDVVFSPNPIPAKRQTDHTTGTEISTPLPVTLTGMLSPTSNAWSALVMINGNAVTVGSRHLFAGTGSASFIGSAEAPLTVTLSGDLDTHMFKGVASN